MAARQMISKPQPKLGQAGLLCLLVGASLLTPLSMDMYTPAIPEMVGWFSTTESLVNLTLVGYFLMFAVGLLACGPVSDGVGRRPVLVLGSATYTLASFACALSGDIWSLIAFRALEAFGAGAVSAVATAVVKDSVVEERRELVLSVVQVMFVVGPVVAPVVGSFVIMHAEWRYVFVVLGLGGVAMLAASLAFEETLPREERRTGGVVQCARGLASVARNRRFMWFLGVVATFNVPFMAYIAVGSYVYIEEFGLTPMDYSVYYAVAAAFTVFGPLVWLAASRVMDAKGFTTLIIGVSIASGALVLSFGGHSPTAFCLAFLPFALMESTFRPYSTNVLLASVEADSGAASGIINFTHTVVGCAGMLLAVLPWPSFVFGIGFLTIASMALGALLWAAMLMTGSFPKKPSPQAVVLERGR